MEWWEVTISAIVRVYGNPERNTLYIKPRELKTL